MAAELLETKEVKSTGIYYFNNFVRKTLERFAQVSDQY